MEDYDSVWTIEANGSKGWEVVYTGTDTQLTLARFAQAIAETDGTQYRLTTPKGMGL